MVFHEQPNLRQRFLQSAVVKRSVVIAGRKTSVSLEDAFWGNLKEIAHSRDMTLTDIVGQINDKRDHGNLSSSIRLFVLEQARAQREQAAQSAAAQVGKAASAQPC